MNFKFFVGIDVSKLTLDFTVVDNGNELFHVSTSNNLEGIRSFFQQQPCLTDAPVLFCMEHTGIYNNPLLEYFEKHKLAVWLQSARQIKQSIGMQRGKNDKVDSYRIAMYAYRHQDTACLWQPTPKKIKELKHLITLREQLVKSKTQLTVPLKQSREFIDKHIYRLQLVTIKPILKKIEKQLKLLDQKIENLIKADQQLCVLHQRITSVDHIGAITATHMIACTNGFTRFSSPKKFACYCGVVPFTYQSGTSLMGKNRISHLANKRTKTLLHLAAMSAVKHDGELKRYYQRKVQQGKNKMLVLNAIRNKLIHRIFAVVRDQREYDKNYIHTLV